MVFPGLGWYSWTLSGLRHSARHIRPPKSEGWPMERPQPRCPPEEDFSRQRSSPRWMSSPRERSRRIGSPTSLERAEPMEQERAGG
ncbi:hypothetical protein NL676_030899 [Syzygium grande]|nr:hypothetical protein NL676_030899 [Syzygium grande]